MNKRTAAVIAALLFALTACAHDETVNACKAVACGGDNTKCVSDREANLGEIGGRCGDAGTQAALDVYACQATLTCDTKSNYAGACGTELTTYDNVRSAGNAGCQAAPDVVAP